MSDHFRTLCIKVLKAFCLTKTEMQNSENLKYSTITIVLKLRPHFSKTIPFLPKGNADISKSVGAVVLTWIFLKMHTFLYFHANLKVSSIILMNFMDSAGAYFYFFHEETILKKPMKNWVDNLSMIMVRHNLDLRYN